MAIFLPFKSETELIPDILETNNPLPPFCEAEIILIGTPFSALCNTNLISIYAASISPDAIALINS